MHFVSTVTFHIIMIKVFVTYTILSICYSMYYHALFHFNYILLFTNNHAMYGTIETKLEAPCKRRNESDSFLYTISVIHD